MIVRPVKTAKILPGKQEMFSVLDGAISELKEKSVLVVTSKIVALCENRVLSIGSIDKEELIIQESEYYLPKEISGHGHRTIIHNTLVSGAGIDESNADGNYVLLPNDPQASANQIRAYLRQRFGLKKVGVVIADSVSTPLRLGASGTALAWSGFAAINDYRGKQDLFGRKFKVVRANIAGGLAAAAVLVMGEGAEQTPIAIIEDLPFVEFHNLDPNKKELEYNHVRLEDDIFAAFLNTYIWRKGARGTPGGRT